MGRLPGLSAGVGPARIAPGARCERISQSYSLEPGRRRARAVVSARGAGRGVAAPRAPPRSPAPSALPRPRPWRPWRPWREGTRTQGGRKEVATAESSRAEPHAAGQCDRFREPCARRAQPWLPQTNPTAESKRGAPSHDHRRAAASGGACAYQPPASKHQPEPAQASPHRCHPAAPGPGSPGGAKARRPR